MLAAYCMDRQTLLEYIHKIRDEEAHNLAIRIGGKDLTLMQVSVCDDGATVCQGLGMQMFSWLVLKYESTCRFRRSFKSAST